MVRSIFSGEISASTQPSNFCRVLETPIKKASSSAGSVQFILLAVLLIGAALLMIVQTGCGAVSGAAASEAPVD